MKLEVCQFRPFKHIRRIELLSLFTDLRQEIQVRERELRPDNDKATATRRCSSFRVSSSTPPTSDMPSKRTPLSSDPSKPHTHIKSKRTKRLALNCLSGAHKK